MKKKIIQVDLLQQHLSDVLSSIPTNIILDKKVPGVGATTVEIKAKRHSILILPNLPVIDGKSKDVRHKLDNLFPVKKGVDIDDISEYIAQTMKDGKFVKILSTPEGYYKVKKAFEILGTDIYSVCFLLIDECQKLIDDVDYRSSIIDPMDDFFLYVGKAMVSATPKIPNDPRFERDDFRIIEVEPVNFTPNKIKLIDTNNIVESIKKQINHARNNTFFAFFIPSVELILYLIQKLEIQDEVSVFCADHSKSKIHSTIKKKNVHTEWKPEYKKKFMCFTNRFNTGFDIYIEEKPVVMFVSAPRFAEHTMIDPYTDAIQAVGRFRNGIAEAIHIVNINPNLPERNKEGVKEYLNGQEEAYNSIKNLHETATCIERKNAFKTAMETMPFHKFLSRTGKYDYYLIDNYIDNELITSAYRDINTLSQLYSDTVFDLQESERERYQITDVTRKRLENNESTLSMRKEVLPILDQLFNIETQMNQNEIDEIRKIDPLIVEAYEKLGKERIIHLKYNTKKMKEALIMDKYNNEITGKEFLELLHNSFRPGERYTLKNTKEELKRIHDLVNLKPTEAITAKTIEKFFDVRECKMGNSKAILILEPRLKSSY